MAATQRRRTNLFTSVVLTKLAIVLFGTSGALMPSLETTATELKTMLSPNEVAMLNTSTLKTKKNKVEKFALEFYELEMQIADLLQCATARQNMIQPQIAAKRAKQQASLVAHFGARTTFVPDQLQRFVQLGQKLSNLKQRKSLAISLENKRNNALDSLNAFAEGQSDMLGRDDDSAEEDEEKEEMESVVSRPALMPLSESQLNQALLPRETIQKFKDVHRENSKKKRTMTEPLVPISQDWIKLQGSLLRDARVKMDQDLKQEMKNEIQNQFKQFRDLLGVQLRDEVIDLVNDVVDKKLESSQRPSRILAPASSSSSAPRPYHDIRSSGSGNVVINGGILNYGAASPVGFTLAADSPTKKMALTNENESDNEYDLL
jgi:hypothetical protein